MKPSLAQQLATLKATGVLRQANRHERRKAVALERIRAERKDVQEQEQQAVDVHK